MDEAAELQKRVHLYVLASQSLKGLQLILELLTTEYLLTKTLSCVTSSFLDTFRTNVEKGKKAKKPANSTLIFS